jgi:hypothetical protein
VSIDRCLHDLRRKSVQSGQLLQDRIGCLHYEPKHDVLGLMDRDSRMLAALDMVILLSSSMPPARATCQDSILLPDAGQITAEPPTSKHKSH